MGKNDVYSFEHAASLELSIRKLVQDPKKILKAYIGNGMTVLDLGCGPGYFSIEIAKMTGKDGHVIAADLQEEMLKILERKIKSTDLVKIIELHKCGADRIGVKQKVDFILAFYVVHEFPDRLKMLKEIKEILKPGGKIFICEPTFRVNREEFGELKKIIREAGFEIEDGPGVFMGRTAILSIR